MQEVKVRQPFVAGQFYAGSKEKLKTQIESLIDKKAKKQSALACMLPHAGYMYSGKVAAETVSRISIPDILILLGPNHTGSGAPFSIMAEGVWQTPLGEVRIYSQIARELLKYSKILEEDIYAHISEHSIEVELPFFQYFKPEFNIVPMVLSSGNIDDLKQLGKEIADTIISLKLKDKIMIVASSDMTHYESQEDAERKDKEAIGAILELDEDKLIQKVRRLDISMCGYAPAITMIKTAKLLGANHAQLIKYQTSGDVTGDKTSVVGYAGILIN